jgi:hypothetical protein
MATEAPLIHDGSQCTAAVNMSNTAGLSGPSGSGQFLAVKITAARSVAYDNVGASVCYGILQNKPAVGQAADVGILGVSKAVAGAALSAGALLMTDSSGRVITRTSTNPVVGQAIEAATAANQIITIALVPAAY